MAAYEGRRDALVPALPRGGVPVGAEVAAFLHAPLDVFVVRKLGLPGQPELAMGAIASGGVRVLNREVIDQMEIPASVIDAVADADEVICAVTPQYFSAVGLWYENFSQTSDEEVRALLAGARDREQAEKDAARRVGATDGK